MTKDALAYRIEGDAAADLEKAASGLSISKEDALRTAIALLRKAVDAEADNVLLAKDGKITTRIEMK